MTLSPGQRHLAADLQILFLAVLAGFSLVICLEGLIHLYLDKGGGVDFYSAYLVAARHLLNGQSPYTNLPAGPIAAQTYGAYFYPPTFAWFLIPFLCLSQLNATLLWLGLQITLLVTAVWLAAMSAGAKKTLRLVLALIVATLFFVPTYDALGGGNVGIIITLGVALLLWSTLTHPEGHFLPAPLVTALGILKLTPGLLLLPLLVANPRRNLKLAGLTLVLLVGPFFLLNPGSWLDYLRIPFSLITGDGWYFNNLAPTTVFAYYWPAVAGLEPLIRLLTIGGVLILLGASLNLAHRPAGLPAALMTAYVASLLLSGTLWGNYFEALLPGVIITWIWSGKWGRILITVAYLVAWVGFFLTPPLETIGLLMLGLTIIQILRWPKKLQVSDIKSAEGSTSEFFGQRA